MPNQNPVASPPLLLASPVTRSGTTLVQRLLCSASNCLVYGESCANDLMVFSNLLLTKKHTLRVNPQQREAQLQRVLAGQVNDWIADLGPPIAVQEQAYLKSMQTVLQAYGQFAAQQGRPIWGVKLAGWLPQNLVQFSLLFPKIKLIYIVRPLKDCVRSAKGAGHIHALPEVQQYAQLWQQNQQFIAQHFPKNRLLWLPYEKLLSQTPDCIQQLETFSGAADIDPTVLNYKINTTADPTTEISTMNGYERPFELTKEEQQLLAAFLT